MPSVPHITRIRRRRWNKYHNTKTQRGGLVLALLVSISFVLLIFGVTFFYSLATQNLPSLETLPLLIEPPGGLLLQATRFYDRSGEHVIHTVENPAVSERRYYHLGTQAEVQESDDFIHPNLVSATIAISDPTFWSNPGFSFQGTQANTHNTLAQKLVSDLILWDEVPGFWRSIRERLLAAQITERVGREKVIEWYLNSTDFGNLAYGVGAATQVYFGKSPAQLNLAEAAILAAVAESPALNPHDAPQAAIERGKVVLDALLGQGLITPQAAAQAKATRVTFRDPEPSKNVLAPAFIHLAWEHLSIDLPIERVQRGGFQIITTLDYDLQTQASCTTQVHLSRIQTQNGLNPEATSLDESPAACPASQLLATLSFDAQTLPTDLSANVMVLDPHNGQILALVSSSPPRSETSPTTPRPSGSLTTPFIYLTAFTRGFSPASLVWDIPTESGAQEREYQGPIRLRQALANDYLIPAEQTINQIGAENVLQTARQVGLTSISFDLSDQNTSSCPECSLILQGGEISLVEAVQAFGVFANQGTLVGLSANSLDQTGLEPLLPLTILDVQEPTQRAWLAEVAVKNRPVISNQLAYLMTDMLSDEAARWESMGHPNPLEIGRPAGAKMGETASGKDVWTVGFTPQLVVGVWMGLPSGIEGPNLPPKVASSLWHAVIQYATQEVPADSWKPPPGITSMDVCDPSGMLPTLQCPTIVTEVFLSGQEPTQPDTLYKTYQVNRETGRLATVFTPPELIEERIYLNIPPEASLWAESIGLETPPEIYDVLYEPSLLPEAQIQSPQTFETLSGLVTIQGTAGGSDFDSYRLQAGEGLNPSGWIVVQEDTATIVENGALGRWDTSGLNGLYALQLIVLRTNQRVDTTTIQVTIDNQPPDVSIPYPLDGDTFTTDQAPSLTFLVQAGDNLGLARVEYLMDGSLVASQIQPPFAYPWQTRAGKHVLTVKATDQAGNSSEASITFTVE